MNSFVCVISCTCFSITLCTICFLYLFVACLDKISKQWNGRHISKLFLSFYSLTFLSLLPNVQLVFTSDFEKQMRERERERERETIINLGVCNKDGGIQGAVTSSYRPVTNIRSGTVQRYFYIGQLTGSLVDTNFDQRFLCNVN